MKRRGRDMTPAKPSEIKQIRCAIYTRKSSDEGLDQDFNSLDAQRESAESFIASQRAEGWVCVPTRYDDGGFTGGNMDRPALQRLLADSPSASRQNQKRRERLAKDMIGFFGIEPDPFICEDGGWRAKFSIEPD
jgi:hypothetical protein